MSDIFISYSSEDKSRVQVLARALERKGWSVWWDRRIPVGRSYAEVIEEALDGSKAVVVVWTTTSVKSQWVKNEALEGLTRRALFPVMLEAIKIPLEFRHVHAAHLMDWQPDLEHAGFDQFIEDLAGVIGSPVMQGQVSPASTTRPRSEPEMEPGRGMVRVALSGNNNLSALTLSSGTLEPAFAASTTDYTVNVASDVSSVDISATKADPDAVLAGVVKIGSGTATGQVTIQLNGPGVVTTALFTVTAPNGDSKSYRIMVNRAALSGNNNLSALTISPGSLSPAFKVRTLNYTVNVGSTVTSLTVTPRLQDTTAIMVVNGQATSSGQARTIALSGPGSNILITILVTAPNGTQKTYTLNVSRAALSGNNNLQSLTVSPGTLSPSFDASSIFYTANVGGDVSSVTVTPTLQDSNSSMTINGQGTRSGQALPFTLAPAGSGTEIEIIVTAPNGSSKTYFITVRRAALPRVTDVEPESERSEPIASASPVGAVSSDFPGETFTSHGARESSEVRQEESAQVGEDPSIQSTVIGQSSDSLPYLPIGIGLLAAIGALVYFVVFSQGPSSQYQSAVQSPITRTEVVPPSSVRESITQPSAVTPQERSAVNEGARSAETITGKDGAPMVLIPAGEFMLGSLESDKNAQNDERPVHPVYLDAYYIDQYEVTTARYAKFFKATNRSQPEFWLESGVGDHGSKPVVGVDWADATAYCSWAGKRLPTEAEWERAARGTDQRVYPWGNEVPNAQRANFNHCCDFKGYAALTDVGSYEQGKSPYGMYDMAGNVWEWVVDRYGETFYSKSPVRNPRGPSGGEYRVLRGGSWFLGPGSVRSALRSRIPPTTRDVDIGFRCAQDIPK